MEPAKSDQMNDLGTLINNLAAAVVAGRFAWVSVGSPAIALSHPGRPLLDLSVLAVNVAFR